MHEDLYVKESCGMFSEAFAVSARILADIFLSSYICAPFLCLLDLFVCFASVCLHFSRLCAPCVFVCEAFSPFDSSRFGPVSDLAAQTAEDDFLMKASRGRA